MILRKFKYIFKFKNVFIYDLKYYIKYNNVI